MNNLFQDNERIVFYADLQSDLFSLEQNPSDDTLNLIINQIPSNLLNEKDILMSICHIFAQYARKRPAIMKKNSIRLFKLILPFMKKNLQNESSFLWGIFGGLLFFKLWMYEEGLITFDQIILSAQNDETSTITEYFLPEIIDTNFEIFEKELKYRFKKTFSSEKVEQFRELRKKYFKWLIESGDYQDSIYSEIENNKLRLSIKRDDIDTFQEILSKSNISINSTLYESTLENSLIYPCELKLIEYAAFFNSVKIFKFLLMNDANLTENVTYYAISNQNYDLIHILETRFKTNFEKTSFFNSLNLINNDMTEYLLNNYDFTFLDKDEVDKENYEMIFKIIDNTFQSFNLIFFKSTLLPFLKNNEKFVSENIYIIVISSILEKSCFFFKEFVKYPNLDLNLRVEKLNTNFLLKSIQQNNTRAVEILLSNPKIDINRPAIQTMPPFHIACKWRSDLKIIKLFCNHPQFDINFVEERYSVKAFDMAATNGNFYAIQYIIDKFPDLTITSFNVLFIYCLSEKFLLTLKIILKYYFSLEKSDEIKNVAEKLKSHFNLKNELSDLLTQIYSELNLS